MKDNILIPVQGANLPAVAAEILDLENFLRSLYKQPEPSQVKVNEKADNSLYLPISIVETTLDEVYHGLWSTRNFTTRVIANELVGEIELMVFHPVAKVWLTRIGAAAQPIMFHAKSDISVLSNKIKNALVRDYPHLKAQAVKNAALSLGVIFGRDLNREHTDTYVPSMETQTDREFQIQEILSLMERRSVPDKVLETMRKEYTTMSGERLEKAIAYLKTCPAKPEKGGGE